MAPKKRTKEEIAAEKARKAEEARIAEEERQRQAEEAQRLAEQVEATRLQLLSGFTSTLEARVSSERQELAVRLVRLRHEQHRAAQHTAEELSWQRYTSCNSLPQPDNRPDMNSFFSLLVEPAVDSSDEELAQALKACQACEQLAHDCSMLAAEEAMRSASAAAIAALAGGESGNAAAAQLQAAAEAAAAAADAHAAVSKADIARLHQCISSRMDRATAAVLHCADEFADEKGEVLVTAQQGALQLGLWVNTHRNPRFKLVSFDPLGVSVEIPKQVALASCAVLVERLPYCQHGTTETATSCLAPLGGTLQLNLLALPPAAKHSRGWTVRQAEARAPLVLPYPIPPATGAALPHPAGPATWQPEEEPSPFTVSVVLPGQLLVPAVLRVGWWDEQHACWSETGVSGVSFDSATRRLTFSTVHIGQLALLQDTAAALPYESWTIRPTGGQGGATAVISIRVPTVAGLRASEQQPAGSDHQQQQQEIVLEVGQGSLTLRGPPVPQLAHIAGRPMAPWQLLAACEAAGLRLTPGSCEARVAVVQEKAASMEAAMCADLAALCGRFLVASSRWNRLDQAGPDAALVRLSEVTDWEEGGRTQPHHAARIFSKETRVLVARRQGLQGVMLVEAGNNRPEPPRLPDFSTIEGIQAAAQAPFCQLHADLQHLLAAADAAEVAAQPAATLDGLEQVRAVDPVFAETMLQTLQALRLFTFG